MPHPKHHQAKRPSWFWVAVAGLLFGALGVSAISLIVLTAPSTPVSHSSPHPGYHVTAPSLSPPALPPPRPGPARHHARKVHREVRKYTVKAGDTLWGIAARYCGNPQAWRALYRANRHAIGSDPNAIQPGMRYRLSCSYHGP